MSVIAFNTIKEFVRNKILYVILFLAVGLIFLSIVLSKLALSEGQKIILDFSLSVIEIFGLISTLFLGSYLVYNEISKNTILMILSKKPSRSSFILGKYLGFAGVIGILYLFFAVAFILVLLIHHIPFNGFYLWAIAFSYLKLMVLLGFIVFFSTFVSPFITLLVSLAIYFIAHSTAFVKFYMLASKKAVEGGFLDKLMTIIYYLFPNFHNLSIKDFLLSPSLGNYTYWHISISVISNLFYIAILLFFAILIFNKREF